MATNKKQPRPAALNPPPPDAPRRLRLSGLAEPIPKPMRPQRRLRLSGLADDR
jgi:hypothetical protein